MYNKLGRAVHIEMPSELIPAYELLNWVINSILNNPTFISQLKRLIILPKMVTCGKN